MKILDNFNIKTKNKEIYERAFIHNSYANENNTANYERLEFLGDAALDLVISEYLFNNKNLKEGEMTKVRAEYVCEPALFEYSKKLELNEYLKLGKGEAASGGKFRQATVADLFESFLGAVFIDQGLDKVRDIVMEIVIPYVDAEEDYFFKDYKSELQEVVQSDQKYLEYEVIDEKGPSHNKTFTVSVNVDGVSLGKGTSSSKKEAEQLAAKDALEKQIKL